LAHTFNPPRPRGQGKRQCHHPATGGGETVSIRPRPRGQGKPRVGGTYPRSWSVSIRPRPRGQGKPPICLARATNQREFQSAPGPRARGNIPRSRRSIRTRHWTFQIRPGLVARGNGRAGIGPVVVDEFSIRPRPRGQGNIRR